MKKYALILYASALFLFICVQACTTSAGPKPIRYGKDQCAYCKMTVSDARFGTQLLTKKGRAYNFDDIQCMISFAKEKQVTPEDIAAFYVPDFNTKKLLPAKDLFYLKSEALKSPMRGDIAAFSTKDAMEQTLNEIGGTVMTWDGLWK